MQNRMIATVDPKVFFYVMKIELDEISTTVYGRLIHIRIHETTIENAVIRDVRPMMNDIDSHSLSQREVTNFQVIEEEKPC